MLDKFFELRLQKNGLKKEKLRVFSTLFSCDCVGAAVYVTSLVYVSAYTKKNIWIFCRRWRKIFSSLHHDFFLSLPCCVNVFYICVRFLYILVRKLWKKQKKVLCVRNLRLRKKYIKRENFNFFKRRNFKFIFWS